MGVKLGNGKWAIKEDKLLAYNDNSGRFFNKEFDFSRGSSATYVAKDGLIKTAGLQETNLVNNGDFSELGSEIITPKANRDFSSNTGYWTLETGVTIGNGKINFTEAANNRSFYKLNLITVGKTYKLEITISDYVEGFIDSNNGNNFTFPSSNGTHTVYFVGGNPHLVISANGTTSLSIDNVSVKQVDPNDYWTLGTGWSFGDNKAVYSDGAKFSQFKQQLNNNNTSIYQLSFDAIVNAGQFRIKFGSNNYDIISQSSSYKVYGVFNANNTFITFEDYDDITSDFSISNISVKELQADTPRIDFSDSVKGALLLEPQSTNLITYSEDFTQWIKEATVTLTSNYGVSPDGFQNSTRVQMDINDSVYISATSGNIFSIYVKGVQDETIRISNGGALTHTLTGEWDRISLYDTGNSSSLISINTYSNATARDIEIWGAQLEAKSFSTSYIPNYGVSGGVTRLADVCNNSGSAQDFNSEEGVLYCEIAALADDLTFRGLSISDGTTDNACRIYYRNSSNRITFLLEANNVTQVAITIAIDNIKNYNKIAFSYKQNDFKIYINGTQVATDTSGNTPVGLNELSFDRGDGNEDFYGKVREVQVFTEALTDEQLQKLTTI